jgi:AbrB family looped-hinge helix DNA binding protein
MQSTITSKFQTTIPKQIRESLNLSVKDMLEWKIVNGKIIVVPAVQAKFLNYKNSIKTGPGNILNDIQKARNLRIEKFK